MLESFKRDFLFAEEAEFSWGNGGRSFKHVMKRSLTEEVYGVYACVGPRKPNGDQWDYRLIAVAENDDKVVRFFDNEVLRKMFTAAEREELRAISGGRLIEFKQMGRDLMAALNGVWDKESLHPLPGTVDDKEEADYRSDMSRFLFAPGEKGNIDSRLQSTFDGLEKVGSFDDNIWMLAEGEGWYREMALRWLASVVHPEYPRFDMKREKAMYLFTIDQMADAALADPNDHIGDYLNMKRAVEGHEVVSVDFLFDDGSVESLDVYARAFKNGISTSRNEHVIEFADEYAGDPEALEAVADKLESSLGSEDRLWTYRKNVLFIRDGKDILWPPETAKHHTD